MTPNPEDHLQAQQTRAMEAEAVARALELLTSGDLRQHPVTNELSSLLVGMLIDINEALDSVTLIKVDHHAPA